MDAFNPASAPGCDQDMRRAIPFLELGGLKGKLGDGFIECRQDALAGLTTLINEKPNELVPHWV